MRHAHQVGEKKSTTTSIIEHEKKESIRLNKYISSSGHCSRREADRFIEDGKVMIDGVIAEVGSKVFDSHEVFVNGNKIIPKQEFVYIVLNKPTGITCTTDRADQDNIVDYLNYKEPLFPIGRLDKDTSGLILMTNDGDIVNKILRSTYKHEKEYIVSVNANITPAFIERMQSGVKIYNAVTKKYQMTKPCKVKKINSRTFGLILTEGLNRQIRRMCTVLGFRVVKLKRIRVMNIELKEMEVGTWRYVKKEELQILNKSIQKSKVK
ncbi:pseudouridine synthase [Metaclostridioides mangenotii]|uniref:pseudouridine synthase n=1 Tax=Metaclostridioides mangenotii TaxID=1540 RepID=UPI0026F0C9BA|nr:pseudouridine synthase [Clostridioides mangenotii]